MKIQPRPEEYAGYVEHPRYGRAPRFTGRDPNPNSPWVHLHWNTRFLTEKVLGMIERSVGPYPLLSDDGTRMVHGTAVAADLARQTPATVPVTHYYDLDKICRDCGHRFIFFADEQKHWYEDLGFPLEADAVRCPPCRKLLQHITRMRQRYEDLFHLTKRTAEESMEMAECCLVLIEEAIFHPRQTDRVRMLLNSVPEGRRSDQRFVKLSTRVKEAEKMGEQAAHGKPVTRFNSSPNCSPTTRLPSL